MKLADRYYGVLLYNDVSQDEEWLAFFPTMDMAKQWIRAGANASMRWRIVACRLSHPTSVYTEDHNDVATNLDPTGQ